MRKSIIILVSCTVLLLASYCGYRGYKVWKREHLMSLAHQFIAKSDPRNALLCLRQVLSADPRNVEGARMMAGILEVAREPRALFWRMRVVELNPHSLDDRLTLARASLLFRDYASATNALEGVDAPGKTTAAYHNVAGAVAAAGNHVTEAAAHFQEAARLEPWNLAPQMNFAIVRLHSSNELDAAEARIMMERIRQNPTNANLRCQALRELAVDALQNHHTNSALELSKDLLLETNSAFDDRLLRLQVLKASASSDFNSTLAAFERDAGTNSARIYELATWQMANISPKDALTWVNSLPPGVQANLTLALLKANCYTMVRDWPGLHKSLQGQNWGELDFMRRAFSAHALRGQNLADASTAEWALAVNAANEQKESLILLFRLAAQWNWQSEAEDILWTIVNRYPGEKWARQSLTQALFVGGRTRSLMKLYSQELKRSPSDLSIKNNVAVMALLLEANELKPHELAHEVYQLAPTNASYASTYAFSLHVQKRDAEALEIMQRLDPKDLDKPSIAGYYGIILKASGALEKARKYLNSASQAKMLPEEKKLFERARAGA